jgi:hypothetical protein
VTSTAEVKSTPAFRDAGPRAGFVVALPDLLSYEPAISTEGAHLGDGSWELKITRSVMQFRDVRTGEEYVAKTREIVTKTAAQYQPTVVVEELSLHTEPERAPYIDGALLDDLEQAATNTKWKVYRLIALCQGLNDATRLGTPMSAPR